MSKFHQKLCYIGVSIGIGIGIGGGGVSKKFNVKVFYVMSKALSGELSCPCDRSCLAHLYECTGIAIDLPQGSMLKIYLKVM